MEVTGLIATIAVQKMSLFEYRDVLPCTHALHYQGLHIHASSFDQRLVGSHGYLIRDREEIKESVKEGFMFLFLPRKEKIREASRRTPDVRDFL